MLPQMIHCTRTTAVCGLRASSQAPLSRFFPTICKNLQPNNQPFSQQVQSFCCSSRTRLVKEYNGTLRAHVRSVTTSSTTSTTPSPVTEPPQALSWNEYLSLRQKRRYYNLGSSIVTGLATFAGGASFLMTQDLEELSNVLFGLDPVMALGLASVIFGMVGWLTGPFAGEAVFRFVHRRSIRQMEVKEMDFYHRIKKNRCDPSAQSVSNPVPDYYGEKISSVQGYRQWLKDQRAFRKKREMPTL